MKTLDLLKAIASELENSDNFVLQSSDDEAVLETVAVACIEAATAFRKAASKLKSEANEGAAGGESVQHEHSADPVDVTVVDQLKAEDLEMIASMASELDASNDPELQKKASVLDMVLLTISAPKGFMAEAATREEEKINSLKKEYSKTKEELDELNKVSEAKDALEKSPYYKEYRPLEETLSSRTCPDHPGELLARVGEHEYQCQLDKKIYNWETGFKTLKGNTVPGGRVEDQTQIATPLSSVFDTREGRLNSIFDR